MNESPADVQLLVACCLGDEPTVQALLTRHPDLVATLGESDHRQVAHAARNNQLAAVRPMLASGLSVRARGQHGATPLHWAAFHGNEEMARVILHYDPPLEQTDDDYHGTPLGWAIHGSENGWHRESGNYGATVEVLLAAGAKPPETVDGTDAVREVLRRHSGQG
jgi:ankyrin repeat protein